MLLHPPFPRSSSLFTGRREELLRIAGLLEHEVLFLVYGIAGIGNGDMRLDSTGKIEVGQFTTYGKQCRYTLTQAEIADVAQLVRDARADLWYSSFLPADQRAWSIMSCRYLATGLEARPRLPDRPFNRVANRLVVRSTTHCGTLTLFLAQY